MVHVSLPQNPFVRFDLVLQIQNRKFIITEIPGFWKFFDFILDNFALPPYRKPNRFSKLLDNFIGKKKTKKTVK